MMFDDKSQTLLDSSTAGPWVDLTRRSFMLSTAAWLAACGGGNGRLGEQPDFTSLRAFMLRLLDELQMPGAGVAVSHRGRMVYQQGFGWADRESLISATADTLFRVASVSKPITGMAVLRLFENELPVVLDRKVFGSTGLLPDSRYSRVLDSRILDITLRDLLQHSGGWDSDVYEPQYDLVRIARAQGGPAPASAVDVIEYMLREQPLQFTPGTRFCYSNFGYNVLGRIIERHSGLSYEAAARDLVLGPAGATTARIGKDTRAERFPGEAVYYDDPRWEDVPSQTGVGSGRPAYNNFHLRTMDAHGGWVMTAADLVRFADAIDGRSGVPPLLKQSTIALMQTPDQRLAHPSAGLSWALAPGSWSHTGALGFGTHAFLERLDNGVSWAVVYNSLPADPKQGQAGIAELFARTFLGVRTEVLRATQMG